MASELARHCETAEPRTDDGDTWVFAGTNESLESFIAACPPSTTNKAWIAAQHDGLEAAVEGKHGREVMEEISAAWEASDAKMLDTLTALLKAHKYGRGKWMIFVPSADVDAVWGKIVTALWEGKLGNSAKVSGAGASNSGGHVVCVYVDPFWSVESVERVLASLRADCGVNDAIKYKADGVTLLNLPKDNKFGIPPSIYSAAQGSTSLTRQTANAYKPPSSSRAATKDKWTRPDNVPAAPKNYVAPQPKKEEKKKGSAFSALSGFDDDDSAAILAKKRRKQEKADKKKAEEEEKAMAASKANFDSLKANLGSANWGSDSEEDEDELPAVPDALEGAAAGSDGPDSDDSDDELSDEEESAEAAPPAPMVEHVVIEKKKSAEELEVEALMAGLDVAAADGAVDGEKGQSKAAAKRAAKKAAAAAGAGAAAGAAGSVDAADSAAAGGEDADEEESSVPKSADEVAAMMKAKMAAKKKKGGTAPSASAAAAAAEAKARDAGKKKKGPVTYQKGGQARGQKARGSDNKYQGE